MHIWKKSNGQIDRFADEVIYKIVSIQKMRANIASELATGLPSFPHLQFNSSSIHLPLFF